MTVIFVRKSDGAEIVHENVEYMVPNEVCFGLTGYGLHFTDCTYCLQTAESFELVKVQA